MTFIDFSVILISFWYFILYMYHQNFPEMFFQTYYLRYNTCNIGCLHEK
jgi:hypothetical protein